MVFPRYKNLEFLWGLQSIRSPCYTLAAFQHKLLSPFDEKSESSVKISGHFTQLLKSVKLQSPDIFCFDISTASLLNQSVGALQGISNELLNGDSLTEWSALQSESLMELLQICLRNTHIQVGGKNSQQKFARLCETFCHLSFAASTRSILRTRPNTNLRKFFVTLKKPFWSFIMAQSSYRIFSANVTV